MSRQGTDVRPKRTILQHLWDYNVVSILTCCAIIYWLLRSSAIDRAPQSFPAPPRIINCNPDEPVRKVAIVGAGSGGSSAAYYINKFKSPCSKVNVTVYERSDYVGGRSTTVDVFGDPSEPVELGASIFVEVNRNLVSAVKDFGLSLKAYDAGVKGKIEKTIGVYNGHEWVFRGSDEGWWGIAKLLWKYGIAPIRTQRLMKKTVGPFLKMYEEPTFPFKDLSQAVYDLDLTEATALTGEQYLEENGIDTSAGSFASDIIQASTRVNYAQNIDSIHGLETMVCMATDGAMAVQGGNWQIFDGMLKASGASVLLNTTVSSTSLQPNGTYTLTALSSSSEVPATSYDTIILAAPLQFADLKLTPAPIHPPPKIPYVNLHVTLFTSPHTLNPQAFRLSPDDVVPGTVLTTRSSAPPPYFSISTLRVVKNPRTNVPGYLYKIFSPAPISDAYLSTILLHKADSEPVTWIYRKLWQSYPYLPPRVTFEDIQLDEEGKVWYTSGIESFISTMETSSLMGMNVARLVVDRWNGKGKGDEEREEMVSAGKEGAGREDKDL